MYISFLCQKLKIGKLEKITFYHILVIISLVHAARYPWFWSDGSQLSLSSGASIPPKENDAYCISPSYFHKTYKFPLFPQIILISYIFVKLAGFFFIYFFFSPSCNIVIKQ